MQPRPQKEKAGCFQTGAPEIACKIPAATAAGAAGREDGAAGFDRFGPYQGLRLVVQRLTYYRWRREYGGMGVDQARRLTELEAENARFHKAVGRSDARRADDEDALTAAIIRLATHFGRFRYRRITRLLRATGGRVNHKRVARIRRREAGLAIDVKRSLHSQGVLAALARLFAAKAVRKWLATMKAKTLFIEPGSP